MRRPWLAYLAAALTIAAAPIFGAPITLGVPVQEQGLETTRAWKLLCGRAQEDYGVELRSIVLKDHEAALGALALRRIDLAIVDPAWYARNKQDLSPLVELRAVSPDESRVSLIVTISSICYKPSDLAGRSVALTRPGQGAAGYFVPLAILAEAGVALSHSRSPVFAETFESILKGVAYESLEAGAVPSYLLKSPAGLACADFIRIIAESEPLPQLLMVARAGEDPARYEGVVRAFLGLSETETGRSVLKSAGYERFSPVDPSGFAALERYLDSYRRAYEASE